MKRITKEIASNIADKMVNETIGKKINELKADITEKAIVIIRKSTPSIINDVFDNHKLYLRTSYSFHPVFDGLVGHSFNLENSFPVDSNNYSHCYNVSRVDYDMFNNYKDQLSKLVNLKSTLHSQIRSTLLSLVTSKKVKEHFPEAFPYLPTQSETCTDICLPIDDIKNLLIEYK